MQQQNLFKCDFCDFVCSDAVEMDKHEAAHFGLTPEEMHEYNSKKQFYLFVKTRYEESKDKVSEEMQNDLLDKITSTKKELNAFESMHCLDITE